MRRAANTATKKNVGKGGGGFSDRENPGEKTVPPVCKMGYNKRNMEAEIYV